MANDAQEIIGTWIVKFRQFKWEYAFTTNPRQVTWVDPNNNGQRGSGTWTVGPNCINITWIGSSTTESWDGPISDDNTGTIKANYGSGQLTSTRKKAQATETPPVHPRSTLLVPMKRSDGSTVFESVIDFSGFDPRGEDKYIDTVMTAVGYSIYTDFIIFTTQAITPHVIKVPPSLVLWGGSPYTHVGFIYKNKSEADAVVSQLGRGHIAYYWAAGGCVIAPTRFTSDSAPNILRTASDAIDRLVKEVTDELTTMGIGLAGGLILDTVANIGKAFLRLRPKSPKFEPIPEPKMPIPKATARTKASPQLLRDFLSRSEDIFVWATTDEGIIEDQAITFTKKTNPSANEGVHFLRGKDAIRGSKYGNNKVAIDISKPRADGRRWHVTPLSGPKVGEFVLDGEVGPTEGVHFNTRDVPK